MTRAAQLSLFKGKRQRGIFPREPKENFTHKQIAQVLNRWLTRGWICNHFPAGERRDYITGARLKSMGLKPGWADFILLSPLPSTTHFLELKRRGNDLTDAQLSFKNWCDANHVPYAVAYDFAEAIAILATWGAVPASWNDGQGPGTV